MENQIGKNDFSDDRISTIGIKQESSFARALRKNKVLLMMLIPAFLYFFIFSYLPMSGAVVAFKSYNFRDGIFGSPWVGFSNFEYFFKSGQAWTVTRNTILYNVGFIVVNTVLQMGLAIFISEIGGKYFKKITQTAMFLPYFISWVVVGMIAYNFLNVDYGTVNTILNKKSGLYGITGLNPDFREIELASYENDQPKAQVAIELFTKTIAQFVAKYAVSLKGIDAVVFTGGIGENQINIRKKICNNLEWMGLELDLDKNNVRSVETKISTENSKILVYVIPTDEEMVIARDTKRLVEAL